MKVCLNNLYLQYFISFKSEKGIPLNEENSEIN